MPRELLLLLNFPAQGNIFLRAGKYISLGGEIQSALLIHYGIEARTHTGVRQMLGKEFVLTGILSRNLNKFYTDLFSKRQNSDYEDFINYTAEEIDELYPLATTFIDAIEQLIKE